MKIDRRVLLKTMGGACSALAYAPLSHAVSSGGPFKGTRSSLTHYHVPDWFRDAQFGI